MATVIYKSGEKLAARNTPGWARVQQEMGADANFFDHVLHARASLLASNDCPLVWTERTPYSWELVRLMEILTEICELSPERAATAILRAIHDSGQTDKFNAETPAMAAVLGDLAAREEVA